jgi:hypothetical protein
VSAILKEACHPVGALAAVREVDEALAAWPRITAPGALRAGDVICWRPTRGSILGFRCPGHWHIGVSLGGDATVDNDWFSGKPKRDTLDRACRTFDHARRPPT